MTTATALIDFAQFERLEDPPGGYLELHHGELVTLTVPKLKHSLIQNNLREMLRATAPTGTYVDVEMGFKALPDFDARRADVAYLSAERFASVNPESYIEGAPDLVIEVLSPSNTASEIFDKEQMCLSNGAQEFWVVDPKRCEVRVTSNAGRVVVYKSGQSIPLMFNLNASVSIDEVFRMPNAS